MGFPLRLPRPLRFNCFFQVLSALDLSADHGLRIWDALSLAVATDNRCRLLLSEDLQDGDTWRGMTVVNPFVVPRSLLLLNILTTG